MPETAGLPHRCLAAPLSSNFELSADAPVESTGPGLAFCRPRARSLATLSRRPIDNNLSLESQHTAGRRAAFVHSSACSIPPCAAYRRMFLPFVCAPLRPIHHHLTAQAPSTHSYAFEYACLASIRFSSRPPFVHSTQSVEPTTCLEPQPAVF